MADDESELVRALKQVIELRSSCNNSSSSSSRAAESPSLTLFGKKIAAPTSDQSSKGIEPQRRRDDCVMQSIEKLTTASRTNLTHLYKQHLHKRRGRSSSSQIEASDTLTLPLLSSMQDHNAPDAKRQKTVAVTTTTTTRSQPAHQLSVFYKGQIIVYDDVPLDKAKAMMILAGSSSSNSAHFLANSSQEAQRSFATVPQARKASLQRFLEKRRERFRLSRSDLALAPVVKQEAAEELPCFSRSSSPCSRGITTTTDVSPLKLVSMP